ncbi:MAG: hypothetical protein J0L92_11075 [Deltaproteobacteria bacterium]|nr:hypothetical protein [Deltaproteobacteria bacterium]
MTRGCSFLALSLVVVFVLDVSQGIAQDATTDDVAVPATDATPANSPAASVAEAAPTTEVPPAPSPALAVAAEVGVAVPQLTLDDINRRSSVATALYISSSVLLATGGAGVVIGAVLIVGGSFGGSTGAAGAVLFGAGALALVGHVITLAVAISYDVGSTNRRDAFRRAYPDLQARLTSGPGDAGLGFALDF